EKVWAMSVFWGSYTRTYATPRILANSSTSDCTDEASRVEIRSTPEVARLEAMASPLELNSAAMLVRSDRAETYHVMAARGIRAATRKSTIFPRRPSRIRARGRVSLPCSLACSSFRRAMEILLGASGPNRRAPVGHGHPA